MFGMGWQEILLILVIAVLVIGPDQLPQVARSIGKVMAQFRRVANDLRDSVNQEFNGNEGVKEFREFQQSIDSEVRNIGYTAKDLVDKEVAKEEAALKELEEDVRDSGDGPGPLSDPKGQPPDSAPPDGGSYGVGDFPTDEEFAPQAPTQATAQTTAQDDTAPGEPAAPDADASSDAGSHKESA